jgi:putative acetyltransferase
LHASPIIVRPYGGQQDAEGTYAVFTSAITRTASADYDPEQIDAWLGARPADVEKWNGRRTAARTWVATADGRVVGFSDLVDDGLLDMLFVHPDFGGRGVARLLVGTVKREAARAGLPALRTRASRTAKPAFERFGFRVVAFRPDNRVGGQIVPNYEMECVL